MNVNNEYYHVTNVQQAIDSKYILNKDTFQEKKKRKYW